MNEQEEFERIANHMELNDPELREVCWYFWQACAYTYEEKITEIMVASKIQAEDWLAHLKELRAKVEELETTAKSYDDIFDEVSKVYYHITEGRLSKPNTDSMYIIQAHDDQINALENKIEQQATEIEALRGFAKEVSQYGYDVYKNDITECLYQFNLVDENGNPTTLLTGDRE